MALARSFNLLVVAALIGIVGVGIHKATALRTATINIEFVHYVQQGIPEQDVFVEPYAWIDDLPSDFVYPLRPRDLREEIPFEFIEPRSILAPNVVRVEPRDARSPAYLSKSLYAAETVIPHDPSQSGLNALGPFSKGDMMGLTLREWLAAQGSGIYTVMGNDAELNLSFRKLMPYGRYLFQCIRIPVKPAFDIVETECLQWSRLHTAIRPDADGNATLRLELPALPQSIPQTTTMLQLVYQREIIRWDGDPGGYGWNEHVQLMFEMPMIQD